MRKHNVLMERGTQWKSVVHDKWMFYMELLDGSPYQCRWLRSILWALNPFNRLYLERLLGGPPYQMIDNRVPN